MDFYKCSLLIVFNKRDKLIAMKNYCFTILFVLNILFSFNVYASNEVNVYSYRQPILIDPFFDEFTKSTGIKVNVLHAKKGLLERLLSEGANTPADLVLTVDISRLKQFVDNDILIPIVGVVHVDGLSINDAFKKVCQN